MFYFELATGLRRGELFSLKWSDIDFQTGAIRIQRQVQRLDSKVQETKLKTNNSYRTILVDRDILEMLITMKEERKIESDYVFCSPTGGILEPGSQRKRLQRLLESCGMEKIRFHDLRYTFATLVLQNGVDVKTPSGLLGHYSSGFTLAHLRTHFQPDAAGCGSEGGRISRNEYVKYHQMALHHSICRIITTRRNKFPVLRSTEKTLQKTGNFEHLKEKAHLEIRETVPVWVKSGSKTVVGNFDPNHGWIYLGQLGG